MELKMPLSWDDIKRYDDLCVQHCRDEALRTIAHSTYKCEFLKRKGEHFRFCSIDKPDESVEIAPSSPLISLARRDEYLELYCYAEFKCPEFKEKISKIREADESTLERICRKKRIKYIPPEEQDISSLAEMRGNHANILGRNYPAKEFEDKKGLRKMPYTVRYGTEVPIICSASLSVQKVVGTTKSYLLMQEAKEGSGHRRKDSGKFDIPGGAVEPGESFEECAKREFREETGATPKIHRLVGVFEKINQNNRLIWKAVYTGSISEKDKMNLHEDTSGFAFFELGAIRLLYKNNLLKTPDIMLIMNRIEHQMIELNPESGEDGIVRLGWD